MSLLSFRFLHASDFHLDQPLGGVIDVPEHLRDPFIDAPYQAASRVFDAAISERVDFVVVAGDILHPPTATPRGRSPAPRSAWPVCSGRICCWSWFSPWSGSFAAHRRHVGVGP